MKYKHKKPFRAMQDAAIGMAGIGITTGVAAGVSAQAPAGTPSMMGGFSALAGFAPIAATATIGKSLLPKRKKKSKYGF